MEKIETEARYDCSKMFDVMIDTEKLRYEEICRDKDGRFILHVCETYNFGSAYSETNDYFILDNNEYVLYLNKARKNKQIGWLKYRKFLKEKYNNDSAAVKSTIGKIVSFDTLTLHTSGMRYVSDYEIVYKNGHAEVSCYNIRYREGEKERVLDRRVICSEGSILKLLNDCRILSWDGFCGPHPKGVLDGTMFSFDATVNGDKKIHASGSQNFPAHYRDFTDALYYILREEDKSEN